MYHHPRHPLPARTDFRRAGVDPGGVHAGGAGEPPGLGHVRVRLLLRHDLRLDGVVRLRRPSQQKQLGGGRLCVSRHRRLLLPQRRGEFGQSDPGLQRRDRLQNLQAGHLCSGLLVRGDAPLLHPRHPVCHPLEVLLAARRRRRRLTAEVFHSGICEATSGSPSHRSPPGCLKHEEFWGSEVTTFVSNERVQSKTQCGSLPHWCYCRAVSGGFYYSVHPHMWSCAPPRSIFPSRSLV